MGGSGTDDPILTPLRTITRRAATIERMRATADRR
jgi:hypothetical protein